MSKILALFVKSFTADGKYFPLNRDNSRQPIQMELFKKEKRFSEFFAAFLKPRSIFELPMTSILSLIETGNASNSDAII